MGIEPTSAIFDFSTAGCGKLESTAARRLNLSAFGGHRHQIHRPTPAFSPAIESLGHIALINLQMNQGSASRFELWGSE